MLKVWRGHKGTIFAECTQCGSYGTANHLKLRRKLEPDIEKALEQHTARCMALRSHYTTATNKIIQQIKNGTLQRREGSDKIRELWVNHVTQVRLAEAQLPDPTGKVKDAVNACPWCETIVEEFEVEQLPEGAEPPFSLARKREAIHG